MTANCSLLTFKKIVKAAVKIFFKIFVSCLFKATCGTNSPSLSRTSRKNCLVVAKLEDVKLEDEKFTLFAFRLKQNDLKRVHVFGCFKTVFSLFYM